MVSTNQWRSRPGSSPPGAKLFPKPTGEGAVPADAHPQPGGHMAPALCFRMRGLEKRWAGWRATQTREEPPALPVSQPISGGPPLRLPCTCHPDQEGSGWRRRLPSGEEWPPGRTQEGNENHIWTQIPGEERQERTRAVDKLRLGAVFSDPSTTTTMGTTGICPLSCSVLVSKSLLLFPLSSLSLASLAHDIMLQILP